MHNELRHKGFEVLAFPANAFFNQEPGSNEEIRKFVWSKFRANFTMFEKVDINGPNTHPVYRWLRNNSDLFDKEKKVAKLIPLNFSKFLLNGRGEVVKFFEPLDTMDDVRKEVKMLL